ncbi:MAG: hypothetical protein HWD58_13590 [Bacteroidota bacterium]|nr:MAG: hypothetical protein HWD58_13590 [Bacteroidota bacterium]
MLYNYAGLGVRFKMLKTDASEAEKHMAYVHSTPETSFGPYSIASFDWGMGLRVLMVKNIGLMAEFGVNPGIGQFGLFYRLMPRSRKKKIRMAGNKNRLASKTGASFLNFGDACSLSKTCSCF